MFTTLSLATVLLSPRRPDESGKLHEALTAVLTGTSKAMECSTFGYRKGISVLGAYLDAGKSITFASSFEKGVSYVITAGGDTDSKDVDLKVTSNGSTLAEDSDHDPVASVAVESKKDQKVNLVATNAGDKPAMVCVTILTSSEGWDIAEASRTQFLEKCDTMTGILREGGLGWQARRNAWCLFGGIVKPAQSLSMINVPIPKGHFGAVGFSDDLCKSLRVSFEAEDGSETASTKADDGAPAVLPLPETYAGKTKFTVFNLKGEPSLMAVAIGG